MGYETDWAVHIHGVEKRTQVIRQHAAGHLLRGTRVGLRRVTKASQIRSKQLEAVSEDCDEWPPHIAELGPAMEHEGRAATLAEVMDVDAVRAGIKGLRHRTLPEAMRSRRISYFAAQKWPEHVQRCFRSFLREIVAAVECLTAHIVSPSPPDLQHVVPAGQIPFGTPESQYGALDPVARVPVGFVQLKIVARRRPIILAHRVDRCRVGVA